MKRGFILTTIFVALFACVLIGSCNATVETPTCDLQGCVDYCNEGCQMEKITLKDILDFVCDCTCKTICGGNK